MSISTKPRIYPSFSKTSFIFNFYKASVIASQLYALVKNGLLKEISHAEQLKLLIAVDNFGFSTGYRPSPTCAKFPLAIAPQVLILNSTYYVIAYMPVQRLSESESCSVYIVKWRVSNPMIKGTLDNNILTR